MKQPTKAIETTFFTADSHFGHANIIRYCERPFSSAEEMDEALIEAWNAIVPENSMVYHLGDLTLGKRKDAKRILSRLHGQITILNNTWHHDSRWIPSNTFGATELISAPGYPVHLVPPIHVLRFAELSTEKRPQIVVLSHYPQAVWDRKHYGSWHLHGHSHGQYQAGGLLLDVGVDMLYQLYGKYRPISLVEVQEIIQKKGQ